MKIILAERVSYDKSPKEAQKKFDTAKKALEESGAEFVSNEEFAKLKKESKASKPTGTA